MFTVTPELNNIFSLLIECTRENFPVPPLCIEVLTKLWVEEKNYETTAKELGITKYDVSELCRMGGDYMLRTVQIMHTNQRVAGELKKINARMNHILNITDAQTEAVTELKKEYAANKETVYKLNVVDLVMPVRLRNILLRLKCTTVGDVMKLSKTQLLKQRNMGVISLIQLENVMREYGVEMKP